MRTILGFLVLILGAKNKAKGENKDLDSFFLFLSLVEILTVSLGPKA